MLTRSKAEKEAAAATKSVPCGSFAGNSRKAALSLPPSAADTTQLLLFGSSFRRRSTQAVADRGPLEDFQRACSVSVELIHTSKKPETLPQLIIFSEILDLQAKPRRFSRVNHGAM
jgi:hypothetical protein